MRCLAIEGAKAGITVNVLAPNAYSRMTADLFPEGSEEHFAPGEGLSPAIAWLCSDEAAEITGRQFVISGNPGHAALSGRFSRSRIAPARPGVPRKLGPKIRESMADWPEAATVPKLGFLSSGTPDDRSGPDRAGANLRWIEFRSSERLAWAEINRLHSAV